MGVGEVYPPMSWVVEEGVIEVQYLNCAIVDSYIVWWCDKPFRNGNSAEPKGLMPCLIGDSDVNGAVPCEVFEGFKG